MCDITGFILRSSWLWSGGKKHVRVSFSLATRGPADCDDWCILTSLETYLLYLTRTLPLSSWQVCSSGSAALSGGHSLSVPHTQLTGSRHTGAQRGVRRAAFPHRLQTEDTPRRRLLHHQVQERGVSGRCFEDCRASLCICTGPSSHDLKKIIIIYCGL